MRDTNERESEARMSESGEFPAVQSAPVASKAPASTPRPWGCRWPECDCYAPGAPQECRATAPVPQPAAATSAPLDLEAIREREGDAREAAGDLDIVCVSLDDIPALLAEVERLRHSRDRCSEMLTRCADQIIDDERRIAELEAERERLREVADAAQEWWDLRRPVKWTRDAHYLQPTVNCVGWAERDLAQKIAALAPAPAPVARCRCGHDRDAHYDMQSGPCNVVDCGCRDFAPAPAEEVDDA